MATLTQPWLSEVYVPASEAKWSKSEGLHCLTTWVTYLNLAGLNSDRIGASGHKPALHIAGAGLLRVLGAWGGSCSQLVHLPCHEVDQVLNPWARGSISFGISLQFCVLSPSWGFSLSDKSFTLVQGCVSYSAELWLGTCIQKDSWLEHQHQM